MALKALVFGSTGQVATELKRLGELDPTVSIVALGREQADLREPAQCAAAITASDADIVINAAAYTAVDKAEDEEALATAVNGDAPGAMAEAAARRGAPFLHISTDYVFDGSGDRPWVETDQVDPLGAYGRSKLAGERNIAAVGGEHVILRTAWVFAAHGGNFVKTMLRVGAERPELRVVDDQRGGPTAARDIATALIAIAQAWREGRGETGVFHFSGAPETTWRRFAEAIFERAALASTPTVVPIATEDWPTPAARPKNSVLDCAKIERVYGVQQPDWRGSLDAVLREIEAKA